MSAHHSTCPDQLVPGPSLHQAAGGLFAWQEVVHDGHSSASRHVWSNRLSFPFVRFGLFQTYPDRTRWKRSS